MALIRLLQRKPDGTIVLCEPTSDPVPAYAILSHTWEKDEVIFQDMEIDADRRKTVSKAGWRKIQFCADQAKDDGVQYFWIDTCCIDKRNAVELGAAINSMFRWYQNAVRCYVYLSDVSKSEEMVGEKAWEGAFRTSRWFTRGWTLQELIAPRLVDFFSAEGQRLGAKLSLAAEICEITGIPERALQGDPLSNFSMKERRSWAARRNTTIEEDGAYCLIGICGVAMVLNYGEGKKHAFGRLEKEIHTLYKGIDFEQYAVQFNLSSFPEAAQFVAREEELAKMHKLLHGQSSRAAVILHGLGGMGKTQLAVEYVRQHKEKYTAIFWLNANDKNSLQLSFCGIAQQVLRCHPLAKVLSSVDLAGDLDRVASAVKTWLDLQGNARWLLVYDNYDNPRLSTNSDSSTVDIRQYLPESDHGSIIVTTRSARVTQGRRLHIQKLTGLEDGLKILANMSGREGIEDDPDAKALVSKLDGLPLALSTAGAYLEHMATSFAEYLRLYEVSWSKLQRTSPKLKSYEDRSLYTTWQVTFDFIQKENAASAQLLKLWAYFDKQDVWFGLLQEARSADDEWIQKLAEDELNFNEAIRLLCEYGLVHAEPSLGQSSWSAGYGMHSCVHSWTMSVLNSDWDNRLAQLALTCVASQVPGTNADKWWVLQQRLLQHAARHKKFITNGNIDVVGIEWALHCLGNLFQDQGRLVEAEALYIQALQGKEEALGPRHTSTLITLNNLGILYADQGRLVEAETMYGRALQGREEALGPKHTRTLKIVNNLGILYADQGRSGEAESMFIRALQGREEVLGPKHKATLNTINCLGGFYAEQGRLGEAESMYNRALQGREEGLGPKHRATLTVVTNLGKLYAGQGRLAEAEAMYDRGLQGYEEIFGRELLQSYLPALDAMIAFGDLYARTGRTDKATIMYNRALAGYATVEGPASEWCKQLEDRLQMLQTATPGPSVCPDKCAVI
ncbi:HET-domain-containing protein [Pyrenochaeta sp. DS3sAY3a]|nr:HET-domain-containing protein [Pyrenochaeta sp. DS3sAY3a]